VLFDIFNNMSKEKLSLWVLIEQESGYKPSQIQTLMGYSRQYYSWAKKYNHCLIETFLEVKKKLKLTNAQANRILRTLIKG
jgi:hypothetical protein